MNVSKGKGSNVENSIKELEKDISQTDSLKELKKVQEKYLGKKGLIKRLFGEIKPFSGEESGEVQRNT